MSGKIKDNHHANLAGGDGAEIHSCVTCSRVDAVIRIVLAGVFRRGLREDLVDTFSVQWREKQNPSFHESVETPGRAFLLSPHLERMQMKVHQICGNRFNDIADSEMKQSDRCILK